MQKIKILIASICITLFSFIIIAYLVFGASGFIKSKLPQDYLIPSAQDSTYTDLLYDSLARPQTMRIFDSTSDFYVLTDSIQEILNVDLSDEMVSSILVNQGLAEELRTQLISLEKDGFPCTPTCLDETVLDAFKWKTKFQGMSKTEIKSFIENYNQKIQVAEANALKILEGGN
ncbi:MAG: hypothetical protein ACPG5P_01250 [Saprospiraceae bacterium]